MNGSNPLMRGDVVLVAFPFTDLSGSKRRPALIVSAQNSGPDCTLAFISSAIPATVSQYELLFSSTDSDFSQTGLKVPSLLCLDKLATLERTLIARRIGKITGQRLLAVDSTLMNALGISLNEPLRQERRRLDQLLATDGLDQLKLALKK